MMQAITAGLQLLNRTHQVHSLQIQVGWKRLLQIISSRKDTQAARSPKVVGKRTSLTRPCSEALTTSSAQITNCAKSKTQTGREMPSTVLANSSIWKKLCLAMTISPRSNNQSSMDSLMNQIQLIITSLKLIRQKTILLSIYHVKVAKAIIRIHKSASVMVAKARMEKTMMIRLTKRKLSRESRVQ